MGIENGKKRLLIALKFHCTKIWIVKTPTQPANLSGVRLPVGDGMRSCPRWKKEKAP